MMSAMDDAVGAVLDKLKSAGLEEDTLVFFISDNGGPPANMSNNGVLRGHKSQTWEGGIRVPYLAQWKGELPAGKVYDQPVIQLDIHSTALAAAGVKLPAETKLDGVNILPHLRGDEKAAPHDRLYWRFGQQMAIRQGNFKLVKAPGIDEPQLFDLAADIGESKDLTAARPEVAKELQTAWNSWNSELVKPRWGPPRQAAAQPKDNN
jgi:arylsulfatase A-like enzyme